MPASSIEKIRPFDITSCLDPVAGRTIEEAIETFREPLQDAVSCVTTAFLVLAGRPYPSTGTHTLALSEAFPSLGTDYSLSVRHWYTLAEVGRGGDRWQLRTTGYSYQVLDVDGNELVVFHWDANPTGHSPVKTPHLHVGRALAHPSLPSPFKERVGRLVKAHLPTGHVTLAAILGVAIDDLGVSPRREDWRERLDAAESVLRASLAWRTDESR
jgi:hypothetical protein